MISCGRGRASSVAAALLAVLAMLSGCKHTEQAKTLPLREIYVHDSIPEQRGEKVVATGVVTYCDPLWHLLIVQDSSQGVYFNSPANLELHAGDQVRITGTTTDPVRFLDHAEFHLLDAGQMPVPAQLTKASQFSDYAGVFAEVPATVRWSGTRNGRATIEAIAGDARLTVIVYPGSRRDLPKIGSEIKIAGVAGAFTDDRGQFEQWRLLTPSARYIQVLKPGPKDLFSIPSERLSAIGDAQKGKLVHVLGKVIDRESSLFLADDSRSISVDLRKPLHGEFASAEVVGFWTGSGIEDAMIRPTGELRAHKGDIRKISELKHLSVAEASARRPVSIRGVVTYFDPGWSLLFVQDQTSAVFVNTSATNLQLKTGDLVDIAGVSGPGDYAPVVLDPAVSFVGHGSLPRPMIVDPVQSNLSMADSHWANLHGVVHSVEFVGDHTNLKLGAGEAAVNVQMPELIDAQRFLDKEVSVTGALGILFNEKRQAIGHQIFVPSPEFISLVGSGGEPNPESTIGMLRRYSPEFDEHHSVGFHGQVVLKTAPNTIFVQDGAAGIQVRSTGPVNINLGDLVSVRGFLRNGDYSPAVEDAVVTREGSAPLPEPEHVSTDNLDEGQHDSEYVSISGTLSAVHPAPTGLRLVLKQKDTYFHVVGAATSPELDALRPGSQIDVRGVFQVTLDRTHVPYTINGFVVVFDSPQSIIVRKAGPWWDARKIRWAVLLFAIFAALSALWAVTLRRKVLTHTSELQLSLAAKRQSQQFDQARNEVLETIARNAPLPESMERLASAIQQQVPNTVCLILMPPDGKSFVDGKPAPLLVAPALPQEVQHSPALLSVLQDAVKADDSHFLAADEDLVARIKDALKTAGFIFASGRSSLVFSASGAVSGMLILLGHETAVFDCQSHQSTLQSASRLISLARDHWQMHERLLHEARHDGLTGLPNRAVAEDRLEQALARAERRKKSFAVFCIDLDGFKAVNDELGHDAGDELLRAVAQRFRGRIRHSDTLARMGGDEFLAIIDDCASDAAARAVANSLIASLKDTVMLENRELSLSASIGIAMYPADGQNASQLKRNSDIAMYRAKSSGGGQPCFLSRTPESPAKSARKGQP